MITPSVTFLNGLTGGGCAVRSVMASSPAVAAVRARLDCYHMIVIIWTCHENV